VKIVTNEQNRKILSLSIHENEYLPIPTWSTGQREFIQVLCGLYYCLPSQKKTKVYYFHEDEAGGTTTVDISGLDPGSDNEAVSGWGGLSGFSGKIAEVVGEALNAG